MEAKIEALLDEGKRRKQVAADAHQAYVRAQDYITRLPDNVVLRQWARNIRRYEFTFSTEAQISKEGIDWYKDVHEQIKWYEPTLKSSGLTESNRKQLRNEMWGLHDLIPQTLGRVEFVANPALWTRDGYSRITGT